MQYVLTSPALEQRFAILLVSTAARLEQYLLTLANCPVFVRAMLAYLGTSIILPGRRPLYLPTLGLRQV